MPEIAVVRRRESADFDERRRQRAVAAGAWVPVVSGAFVAAAEWSRLAPIDRHLVRVAEAAARADGVVTLSHAAAAAIWGIDRIGGWPHLVDTTVSRTSGGRSTGGFRRRTVLDSHPDTVDWCGHRVTSPAQTAADLARISTARDGVIAMDQALWAKRPGGPLATAAQIESVLDGEPRRQGTERARRALRFATPLSDSVRESEGRWLMDRMGFPPPILQRRFLLPGGREIFSDYYFPAYDHAAEFDGVGKYLDPAILRGRTPEQSLIAEKDRGDALRRMVRALSRWRTPAHEDPRLLYDILTADGLPSRRPRPPAGCRLG